jgi:hypothetical protein
VRANTVNELQLLEEYIVAHAKTSEQSGAVRRGQSADEITQTARDLAATEA